MSNQKFIVSLTADFFDDSGQLKYHDIGLSVFTGHPHIEQRSFSEHRAEIGAGQIGDAQAVLVMSPRVTAASVSKAENLLVIARFGVGYDSVDVKACTAADVLVTITKDAVDYSVAEATIGWMLALGHQMRAKDNLVRAGRWDERSKFMGVELRDRTLGVIGLGGIARKAISLLGAFGMKQPLAFDPGMDAATAAEAGARLVSLETLLKESDLVSLHCPLNDKTRGMIGANQLALMKPTAFLLNTARGGIVDEDALFNALQEKRIAGAAIDCFAEEPVLTPHRFGQLDNVLLAPHAIAWTEEQFHSIGSSACQAILDVSLGKAPWAMVNPEVMERPGFKAKWARYATRS